MVKGELTMALDYRKDKETPHTVHSYKNGGEWFVVKVGPGYSNHYRVTEFDAQGEVWLMDHCKDQ